MRHIFIDLGCYDGDSVIEFRNWRHLAYDPEIEWQIYAFDAAPFHEEWDKQSLPWIKFEQKAAWIEDGEIEFSHSEGQNSLGSTVMKEKESWGLGQKIKVPSFDFSKYLEQFRGDHVIVKMDIEGAELPVLSKMIKDGSDDIPHKLFVEWHDGKMPGYQSNKAWIWDNLRCDWYSWR